ncbi:MAG TPA: glycosyltransferase family 4 protein [Caulobacteraceae bacterium]|nr:glycosyltransferase family 4 protein [Caulobacteraceae bacterium]
MINFISNLPEGLRTGGFSAMSAAACDALRRRHAVTYVGPIDPPVIAWEKAISKARRLSGLGGDFFAFSERRLEAIAREVEVEARPDAELDFFHGFTPWVATQPRRQYVAWSDCTFADYVEIYHDRRAFRPEDLARIERAEAEWLRGAARVLFSSAWAAGRALRAYGLDPARVGEVGIFGELEPPTADAYAGAPAFAFVSTNFAAKGGPIVLEAFRRVRKTHPETQLTIVGAAPADLADEPGVRYAGFLRKEDPEQLARFRAVLGSTRAVVHPTRSDIAPLLLVEAAMFGCPAIASRAFAIPELVVDGESGLLLDAPGDPHAVATAMSRMLDDVAYAGMRAAAWRRARDLNSKVRFETRLLGFIDDALADLRAAA